jgi:hypothetical protein
MLGAVVAFNHGTACQNLAAIRDLGQAERWYRRSLDLRAKGDRMGRAKCLGQLGSDAYERFREARNTKPAPELMRHLNDALGRYRDALDMTPPDAVGQLAPIHNELGNIYGGAGDLDRAPHHCRESIRLKEARGDPYGAATTAATSRLPALSGFQTYGASATEAVQKTVELIAHIDKAAAPLTPVHRP